jgi:hypothetical protein
VLAARSQPTIQCRRAPQNTSQSCSLGPTSTVFSVQRELPAASSFRPMRSSTAAPLTDRRRGLARDRPSQASGVIRSGGSPSPALSATALPGPKAARPEGGKSAAPRGSCAATYLAALPAPAAAVVLPVRSYMRSSERRLDAYGERLVRVHSRQAHSLRCSVLASSSKPEPWASWARLRSRPKLTSRKTDRRRSARRPGTACDSRRRSGRPLSQDARARATVGSPRR